MITKIQIKNLNLNRKLTKTKKSKITKKNNYLNQNKIMIKKITKLIKMFKNQMIMMISNSL